MYMRNTYYLLQLALFKFIRGSHCFKFLRSRLPEDLVNKLDKLAGLRLKLTKSSVQIAFLKQCISDGTFPRRYFKYLRRSKIKPNNANLLLLAETEITNETAKYRGLRVEHSMLVPILDNLNIVCRIKFYNHCRQILERCRTQQHKRSIESLSNETTQSTFAKDLGKHVKNLSKIRLTKLQQEALSVGLKFGIPPSKPNDVQVETHFECFYDQLRTLTPMDSDSVGWFKSRLVDLSHQYRRTPVRQGCLLSKQHIKALNDLKRDDNIMILPPDKGTGVVVLNRDDYVKKMKDILSDTSKFRLECNQTETLEKAEKEVSKEIKKLQVQGLVDAVTSAQLLPHASITPRMYGLAKTHKSGTPLRPILSMINSPYHRLAQWLATKLKPICANVCNFSLKDTFQFVSEISNLDLKDRMLVSLDVQSLFTNVSIDGVLTIITDLIMKENLDVGLPVDQLTKLIRICTSQVQFLFDGSFYTQIDGVAMGSPLGPILADIFMGHLEGKIATTLEELPFYRRYVDDTFVVVENDRQLSILLELMNSLHANIQFTVEREVNRQLSFLDVHLTRNMDGSLTRRVYHKSTWTGQYIHFRSFTPISHKRALVRALYYRTRGIATDDVLEEELKCLEETLVENGYPIRFVQRYSRGTNMKEPIISVPRKPVYLRLPFRGDDI